MSYVGTLGQACPPCSFWNGASCVPCPEGSTMVECAGCVGGRRLSESIVRRYAPELGLAIASAVVVGVFAAPLVEALRKKVPS